MAFENSTDVRTGLSIPEGYGIEYADAGAVAAANGCEFVEVLMDGRARPETIDATLGPALAESDGIGLVVHLPFTVPVWSPFDSHADGLQRTHRECLEAAASLGAEAAVVHPSAAAMGDAYDDDEIVAGVLDAIDDLDAAAAALDVELCVENLQSGPFTLDGLRHVVDDTAASLVVDTGHARVSGHDRDATTDFLAANAERVSHLHLNDTRGASDDHLPLGAGTVDFAAIFDALGPDWSGRLSVEAVIGDLDYLEASLERLDELR